MDEDQKDGADKKPSETEGLLPIVGDDQRNKVIPDDINATNSGQNQDNSDGAENPFVVKMDKSNNSWSRAEKISAFGSALTLTAIIISIISVRQTIRSVNIVDSTFQSNKAKDIVAANEKIRQDIEQRNRRIYDDSIRKDERDNARKKDSISISLTRATLDAQINSINETEINFKKESRPLIQLTNIKIDTTEWESITVIYDILNVGKFPANIDYIRCGNTMLTLTTASDIVKGTISSKNQMVVLQNLHLSIANQTKFSKWLSRPSTYNGIGSLKEAFLGHTAYVLFWGEIEYRSSVLNETYTEPFVFKIFWDPMLKVFEIQGFTDRDY